MAQTLSGHGANILAADQHRDSLEGQFFQRIHFDGSELQTDWSSLERGNAEVADRFDMEWTISRSGRPLRVAIFVSKYDHCLWDLLLRHSSGELPCEISLINSNHPDLLEQFGIPYRVFPISRETKAAQEEAEIALIEEREIDLIVLARYMQILSKEFTDHFPHE
jgi:formyltetrahydrofolate deformylase